MHGARAPHSMLESRSSNLSQRACGAMPPRCGSASRVLRCALAPLESRTCKFAECVLGRQCVARTQQTMSNRGGAGLLPAVACASLVSCGNAQGRQVMPTLHMLCCVR